jgi:curved DNA-binding protein CbpA
MLEGQDPYKLLGISRNAEQAELRAAYLRLALRWHPDKHPPETQALAEREFKKVTEAYKRCEELRKHSSTREPHEAASSRFGSRFTSSPNSSYADAATEAYWRAFRRASAVRDAAGFAAFTAPRSEAADSRADPWRWIRWRAGLEWRRMRRGAHAATLTGVLALGTSLVLTTRGVSLLWEKRNAAHSFDHAVKRRASASRDKR